MKKIGTYALFVALGALTGCGDKLPDGPVKARRAAVLVEGCELGQFQRATLADAQTQRVLDEVVLRCLSLREDGAVAPTDPTSRTNLKALATELQGYGYQVSLALTARSDDGAEFAPAKLLSILQNSGLRNRATSELQILAPTGNFLELALPPLPDSGRSTMKTWTDELAMTLRATTRLGLFVPPATDDDPTVAGAGALDVRSLAPSFDRVRVMTLDYSCCDDTPGPTTEPGWLGDAAKYASARAGSTALDVALPLYGVDFSSHGQQQVSYLEAVGLAQDNAQQIQRSTGNTLYFDWTESNGTSHNVWFDDSAALLSYQRAFDPVIDNSIGILYYGLGYEDPSFFAELAQRR